MSRVLFVSMDEGTVVASCLAANVGISAVEALPGGGVRLVCMSSNGAGTMTRKLKSRLMAGHVKRESHRPSGPLW
jgi:hypothetical protein